MENQEKYKLHMLKYTKKGIPRLIEIASQKKYLLYISTAFALLSSVFNIAPFIYIYCILDVLFNNYQEFSDNGKYIENNTKNKILNYAILTFLSYVLSMLFMDFSYMFSIVASHQIQYNIKNRIAEHIGFLPLGYFNKNTTGSINKSIDQNVERIQLFFSNSFPDIIRTFSTILFTIILFFDFNIILTLVCVAVSGLIVIVLLMISRTNKYQKLYVQYYDISEKISGLITQYIYGLPAIKIYGKSVFSFRKLADEINKFREISLECCYIYRSRFCLFIALLEAYSFFIIPIGAFMLLKNIGNLTLTTYIFFIIMSTSMSTPLYTLLQIIKDIDIFEEGANRLDAILNEDIVPPPICPKIPTKYNVTFKNVFFSYQDEKNDNITHINNNQKFVLNDISFEAKNGKITALVGPSGSGKSTIGSLIPRFWDVEKGEICIGDVNVKDITYTNLMNIISFVFQDTFLFNDTVYNNIAIGRPNATKEEIIAAAKAAQCHEFIENLPKKYNTIIGCTKDKDNESVLLSGGERQRVCIARAILKNSPILVLDEATTYSDPENEYKIQLALKELIKDKTVIVIAHNLNTIKSADNIIVVKEGRIVEQGKHDYLLNLNGLYNSMWDAYINSSKWYIFNRKYFEYQNYSNNNNYVYNENNQAIYTSIDVNNNHSLKYHRKKISRKDGMISDNLNLIYNVTLGRPKRLYPAIFYMFLSNVINLIPLVLVIYVIQIIFESNNGSRDSINYTKIWYISLILILLIFVMYLAQFPAYNSSYAKAYMVSAVGRMELIEHIRRLPLGSINTRDPGDMINVLMDDFLTIEECSSHQIPQLYGSILTIILCAIILLFVDWRMAIATFISFPIGMFVVVLATSLQSKISLNHYAARNELNNSFQEYLMGIRSIKAFNMIGNKFNRLQIAFFKFKKESIKSDIVIGPIVNIASFITYSGVIIMILLGSYLLMNNKIDINSFIIFLVVGTRVYTPLINSLYNITYIRHASIAGKRINKFLDLPVQEGSTDVYYSPQKDIVFKNVYFKYLDDKINNDNNQNDQYREYVLKNINIRMKQGSMTALVGPSGSGKSTILKLISRFYDAEYGKITFAGEDISKIDPELYMKNISIVFQDTYLFQDTIANNIKFGNSNASFSQIVEAAKKACCHDFIMKLPNGYDTIVGEGGCTLSGGEKQRISIARAILKDSPVVLLDEATSSLDPENEVEVQKAISELIYGRTVIVISHHLKTIKEADNIIVFDNGFVVEQGSHEQLIRHHGLYRRLWDIQEKYKMMTIN